MIKTSQKRLNISDVAEYGEAPAKKTLPSSETATFQPSQNYAPAANAKIKEMQLEIQKFAQKLLSYASLKQAPKPADHTLDKGKEAILDWIDENFLGATNLQHDAEAREFTSQEDDMESYMDKLKRSTDFVQGKNLAQTLNQIGSPKSKESVAEGIWGPRTQNAIKIVAMFGEALGKAVEALEGTQEVTFDKRSVEYINKIYQIFDTSKKISEDQKTKYAEYVILCVKSLSKAFDSFIRYADKSGLKSYIASGADNQGPRQPLLQVSDKGVDKLQSPEIEKYKTQINKKMEFNPIALQSGIVISPSALLDPSLFKSEVQRQALAKGLITNQSSAEDIKKLFSDALDELTTVSSVPAGMGLK